MYPVVLVTECVLKVNYKAHYNNVSLCCWSSSLRVSLVTLVRPMFGKSSHWMFVKAGLATHCNHVRFCPHGSYKYSPSCLLYLKPSVLPVPYYLLNYSNYLLALFIFPTCGGWWTQETPHRRNVSILSHRTRYTLFRNISMWRKKSRTKFNFMVSIKLNFDDKHNTHRHREERE